MQKTHLYAEHLRLNARMVDFSGWLLPLQYQGIIAEHLAVRTGCGIFDTCHMGRLTVTGSRAAEQLSSIMTVNACSMAPGRCRYGFILNSAGRIMDDLILYRISSEEFMIVVNASTRESDIAHIESQGLSVSDITFSTAKIDVQGPGASSVLSKVLETDLAQLPYFQCIATQWNGARIIISKTGYTGEEGFEVYTPDTLIQPLWKSLLSCGAIPCGLGARDTLRLEAGLPLYGHELTPETTPLDAGYMKYIDLKREFTGAGALRNARITDDTYLLTPFTIEGRQSARNTNRIVSEGTDIGYVTSGSYAPSLNCCIGFGYISAKPSENLTRFQIDTGRRLLDAQKASAPFLKKEIKKP